MRCLLSGMTRRRANNGRRVFTNAKNGSRVFPHSSAEITTLVSATTRMHNVWLAVARGFYGTGKSLLGNLAPEFAQRANFTGRKYLMNTRRGIGKATGRKKVKSFRTFAR